MADVLSQSQIDELLKSMASGGVPDEPAEKPAETVAAAPAASTTKTPAKAEKKFNKYDFYSPRKFTKERIKLLRSIFENYARILTSQVNGVFRAMTDITVMDLKESRYYEYVNSFHENDCMPIIDVTVSDDDKRVNNVPMMMFVTPGLIITLINHMLGGGDQVIKVEDNYRYSDVEMALYRRVLDYFIHALSDGFNNYINIKFSLQRIEENLSMTQEMGLDETVVIVLLNVDVSGLSAEKIRICLPGTLLEHIFKIIDNRKHLARGFQYENKSDTIMDHLKSTKFPITGQLGVVKLDISDVYHLQVGDVIDMNKSKDGLVKLYVGRQPWFTGKMGIHNKNVAVRIEDRIYAKGMEDVEKAAVDLLNEESEEAKTG